VEAVKQMAAQRVALRQTWVVEIVGRIVRHGEFLHHAARAEVGGNRERNDTLQSHGLEAEAEHLACSFGCQASAPITGRNPPAYLDGGHEWSIETRDGKADETQEGSIRAKLSSEKAKAVKLKVLLDAIHHFV
jgi:hypothetical protein